MKPIIITRSDTCPKCNTSKSLEIYNSKGTPLHYSNLLDKKEDLKNKLVDIAYIECKKCHAKYFPRWQDGVVRPMDDLSYSDFMAQYMYSKDGSA